MAQAQISPGALSRAHADLEGITKCTSCHTIGAKNFKCMDCHAEIEKRVSAGTGFHARVYDPTAGTVACANCHIDHRGLNVSLIDLDKENFDHAGKTGFTLQGTHRSLTCESCHTADKIAATMRAEIKMKDLNHSYLGLRIECTACHEDPHRSQLGTSCTECHTQDQWRPAPKFKHSSSAFPLTGLHQDVSCIECHAQWKPDVAAKTLSASPKKAGSSVNLDLHFKGVKFDGCQNCHEDPHRGAFQDLDRNGKCESCHNTNGFKKGRPETKFDHSLAAFPLEGKHSSVTCKGCHETANFQRAIPHAECQNCHIDPHSGQFVAKADGRGGKDCASCHSTDAFKTTLFDYEMHQASAFPLEGKHVEVACSQCHQPEGADAVFRNGNLTCTACHDDPHEDQFAASPYMNQCEQCHTVSGFDKHSFTLDRHSQTEFPLTGGHAEVECGACHKPLPSAANASALSDNSTARLTLPRQAAADNFTAADNARRQFHFDSTVCSACHQDPHRLAESSDGACDACHQTEQWKSLRPFDHDLTKFKLEGPHREKDGQAVACIQCHRPDALSVGTTTAAVPLFPLMSSECSSCHLDEDPHGEQFAGPVNFKKDCSSCHVPTAWDGEAFQHDQTRFPLDVAHRAVECASCHKQQQVPQGQFVRVYRNTSRECLDCH